MVTALRHAVSRNDQRRPIVDSRDPQDSDLGEGRAASARSVEQLAAVRRQRRVGGEHKIEQRVGLSWAQKLPR
jgi:hypothetical protein